MVQSDRFSLSSLSFLATGRSPDFPSLPDFLDEKKYASQIIVDYLDSLLEWKKEHSKRLRAYIEYIEDTYYVNVDNEDKEYEAKKKSLLDAGGDKKKRAMSAHRDKTLKGC